MNSVVCTLFEGHYHYGLAALINSLYKHGFKGDFYAGYRGELPIWAKSGKKETLFHWQDCTTLSVAKGQHIHFIPLNVNYHFCNYKPDFVIELSSNLGEHVSGIFYFDPDIVIKCRWSFYEEWLNLGVPVVHEITNNDMPQTHPIRQIWTNVIKNNGLEVKTNICSYLNSGFFAVKKADIGFAHLFKKFVEVSQQDYKMDLTDFTFELDRSNPFFAKDQDAFNIAAMCTDAAISEYGPEGMDLTSGGKLMSHAIGTPKPWKKKYFRHFLKGSPPTMADREYWNNVNDAIKLYSEPQLKMARIELQLASFLGRFYRKY
ncbi:hypothetical protein [Dyadobacter crusticola]|uniref:hypothetical protein n=1 Tax=Dyadobacter crusticola TaxID=292407 RepID=UPI0004E10C92|nr:hypothetical protein [Dyadobacter crusticola]